MKRYIYFYLSGLNGLPDTFHEIGFVEDVTHLPKGRLDINTERFNRLCKLNHVTNPSLYTLSAIGMEF